MDVKTGLLEAIARSHAAQNALLASLTDEERAASGTSEVWSAKSLLTHIIAWKQRLARGIAARGAGHEPVTYVDLDAENAAIFDEQRDRPWPEVEAALAASQRTLGERINALSLDDLLDPRRFAWQNGQPYWRTIAMNGYWHPMLHLAQFYYDRNTPDYLNDEVEAGAAHLRSLDRALVWQGRMVYDLACYYALSRQKEKALQRLREALRLDPPLAAWARKDTDLATLHGDAAFEALAK